MAWIKGKMPPNVWRDTPPKFNMEPENDGFNKESPFPGVEFSGFYVKLQGVYLLLHGGDFLVGVSFVVDTRRSATTYQFAP